MKWLLLWSAAAALWFSPPPESVRRVVLAPGDTVVATVSGAGQAVVFVPGLLGSSFGFRKVTSPLADAGYRTVVFEPLGTGNSSRPRGADYTLEAQASRLLVVMDELEVGSAHLVCHSVGASICMRAALRSPARVRGIVSINGGPDERAATSGLKTALRLAPLLKVLGAGRMLRGKLVGGLKENSADAAWVDDAAIAGYSAPFHDFTASLRTFNAMSEAVEPDSLGPRLRELRTPVLMLVGTGSKKGAPSADAVTRMAREIPRFEADTFPDAGQYIHEERPERVAASIRQFVERNR